MDTVDPQQIEWVVQAPRHYTTHIGRVVHDGVDPDDWTFYILHPTVCIEAHAHDDTPLTQCSFSRAFDRDGLDEEWTGTDDEGLYDDDDEWFGDWSALDPIVGPCFIRLGPRGLAPDGRPHFHL